MRYEPVIGLEIHVELKTATKMFCYSKNDPDEKHPNKNICPVCMGHPGTLPIINEDAVKKVVIVGLALNAEISEFSQFDRKNYFYPDLPKGYQISQYEYPLVRGGYLEVLGRRIRIRRIHLEEDTGRLIHDRKTDSSLVDFNRAGIPLMELVTEPDFRTGEEVKKFGQELQRILRYVDSSDADMEKGQMRVEVNISLREMNSELGTRNSELGTKVEIKNINSFKYAADAITYEIRRQSELLGRGEKILQETRGWKEFKHETFPQRSKEEVHDYRYFPEPDLPPLRMSGAFIEELRMQIPELPRAKLERFVRTFGIASDSAGTLVADKPLADYFENTVSEALQHDKETRLFRDGHRPAERSGETPLKNVAHIVASLMTGDFVRLLRETSMPIEEVLITPENFAELAVCFAEDRISNLAAKQTLEEMFRSGEDPSAIIDRLGLWQISDARVLEEIVTRVLKGHALEVEEYRNGKTALLQFLIGQVMKETGGNARPKSVGEIMIRLLS